MADKKPTKKGSAAATGAAKKTTARARTEKTVKRRSAATKVSSRPRKKADRLVRHEEALRDTEANFRDFVLTQPDPIEVLALDGTVLMCNETSAAAYGSTAAERTGRNAFDGIPPELAAERRRVLDRVKTTKQRLWINERVQGRFYDTMISPIVDHTGEVVKVAVFPHDVTERRQAEKTLREQEELLQQAVRVSEIGIFDHDQRTNTIYWSPQQRIIYGWDPNEPVTLQDFLNRVHPDDLESISAAVRRAHDPAGDGIWDVEHRVIRRDGSVRWLKERSQTFFEGEGNTRRPVRTVGAVLDITERKRTEEALGASQKLLETIIDAAPN